MDALPFGHLNIDMGTDNAEYLDAGRVGWQKPFVICLQSWTHHDTTPLGDTGCLAGVTNVVKMQTLRHTPSEMVCTYPHRNCYCLRHLRRTELIAGRGCRKLHISGSVSEVIQKSGSCT